MKETIYYQQTYFFSVFEHLSDWQGKKIFKQLENKELNGVIKDEELVLELLEFSTLPLLYMTGDIQKDIEFYRSLVKFNGIPIAYNVFDICDRKVLLNLIKHPKGCRYLNCSWKNDKEIASRAF